MGQRLCWCYCYILDAPAGHPTSFYMQILNIANFFTRLAAETTLRSLETHLCWLWTAETTHSELESQ